MPQIARADLVKKLELYGQTTLQKLWEDDGALTNQLKTRTSTTANLEEEFEEERDLVGDMARGVIRIITQTDNLDEIREIIWKTFFDVNKNPNPNLTKLIPDDDIKKIKAEADRDHQLRKEIRKNNTFLKHLITPNLSLYTKLVNSLPDQSDTARYDAIHSFIKTESSFSTPENKAHKNAAILKNRYNAIQKAFPHSAAFNRFIQSLENLPADPPENLFKDTPSEVIKKLSAATSQEALIKIASEIFSVQLTDENAAEIFLEIQAEKWFQEFKSAIEAGDKNKEYSFLRRFLNSGGHQRIVENYVENKRFLLAHSADDLAVKNEDVFKPAKEVADEYFSSTLALPNFYGVGLVGKDYANSSPENKNLDNELKFIRTEWQFLNIKKAVEAEALMRPELNGFIKELSLGDTVRTLASKDYRTSLLKILLESEESGPISLALDLLGAKDPQKNEKALKITQENTRIKTVTEQFNNYLTKPFLEGNPQLKTWLNNHTYWIVAHFSKWLATVTTPGENEKLPAKMGELLLSFANALDHDSLAKAMKELVGFDALLENTKPKISPTKEMLAESQLRGIKAKIRPSNKRIFRWLEHNTSAIKTHLTQHPLTDAKIIIEQLLKPKNDKILKETLKKLVPAKDVPGDDERGEFAPLGKIVEPKIREALMDFVIQNPDWKIPEENKIQNFNTALQNTSLTTGKDLDQLISTYFDLKSIPGTSSHPLIGYFSKPENTVLVQQIEEDHDRIQFLHPISNHHIRRFLIENPSSSAEITSFDLSEKINDLLLQHLPEATFKIRLKAIASDVKWHEFFAEKGNEWEVLEADRKKIRDQNNVAVQKYVETITTDLGKLPASDDVDQIKIFLRRLDIKRQAIDSRIKSLGIDDRETMIKMNDALKTCEEKLDPSGPSLFFDEYIRLDLARVRGMKYQIVETKAGIEKRLCELKTLEVELKAIETLVKNYQNNDFEKRSHFFANIQLKHIREQLLADLASLKNEITLIIDDHENKFFKRLVDVEKKLSDTEETIASQDTAQKKLYQFGKPLQTQQNIVDLDPDSPDYHELLQKTPSTSPSIKLDDTKAPEAATSSPLPIGKVRVMEAGGYKYVVSDEGRKAKVIGNPLERSESYYATIAKERILFARQNKDTKIFLEGCDKEIGKKMYLALVEYGWPEEDIVNRTPYKPTESDLAKLFKKTRESLSFEKQIKSITDITQVLQTTPRLKQ